jgi:hypothetical protein
VRPFLEERNLDEVVEKVSEMRTSLLILARRGIGFSRDCWEGVGSDDGEDGSALRIENGFGSKRKGTVGCFFSVIPCGDIFHFSLPLYRIDARQLDHTAILALRSKQKHRKRQNTIRSEPWEANQTRRNSS